MIASDLIRRLHRHRMWSNRGLVDAARSLTADQLRQPFATGQGNVWNTLTHLLAAEFVWLAALEADETPLMPGDVPGKLPGNQQGDGAIASFDELVERWNRLDDRWNAYLASLTDETLDDFVYKTSTSSGAGQRHGTRSRRASSHLHTRRRKC